MSETLQGIARRIRSAEELHSVVRTMKALAAVNIRQYEESVRSLGDYARAIETGLHAALLNRTLPEAPSLPAETLSIVFGSDQGMVGQFNEAVIDYAADLLAAEGRAGGPSALWVVGLRAAGAAQDRFGGVEEAFPLPPSSRAVTGAVSELVLRFEERRRRKGEVRLVIYHNAPRAGASYGQHRIEPYPPPGEWLKETSSRRWPRRGLPCYTLPWDGLFSALVGEYLFVSLYRAFAASMAAENAARLAAMQRAEKNIDEMREALTASYHALRQSLITEELFDVISGFEALTGSGGGGQPADRGPGGEGRE